LLHVATLVYGPIKWNNKLATNWVKGYVC